MLLVYHLVLARQNADILVILGDEFRACVEPPLVGPGLFLVEGLLADFLYEPLGVLDKVGIPLAVQVSVPALRKLDTLVNAEIVPLLEDDGLLLGGARPQHIELLLGKGNAELILIGDKFHEQTYFLNGLKSVG